MREKINHKNVVDAVHIFLVENTFACNYISLSSLKYISHSPCNSNK